MIILTLRTDKPIAEIGLYKDKKRSDYLPYQADRMLAETIHQQIKEMLAKQGLEFNNIEGLVVYQGPGSFTGLRIGITVSNALAYSLQVPIVGVSKNTNWIEIGIDRLLAGQNDKTIIPEYGAEPNITSPKK